MTFVQWLLIEAIDLLGTVSGEGAGAWAFLSVVVGTTFALLGLGLVMAATACALVEIDANRPVRPWTAYRLALRRFRPLLGAIALFVLVWVVLTSTVVPHSGRDLARDPLVPRCSGGRARRTIARSPRSDAAPSSCAAAGSGSARSSGSARRWRSSPVRCSARSSSSPRTCRSRFSTSSPASCTRSRCRSSRS